MLFWRKNLSYLNHGSVNFRRSINTQQKCVYTSQLMKLCKNGELNQATQLLNDLVKQSKIKLSHLHISSLIEGCIKSDKPEKYKSIWQQYIIEERVRPNHITYSLAISAASKCNDMNSMTSLIKQMFSSKTCLNKMDTKTFNSLLHSISNTHPINVNLLFFVFDRCKHSDHYTLASLLKGIIESKQFEKFISLLNDVLKSDKFDKCIDCVVVILIFDGMIKFAQCHLFEAIWSKLMKLCKIKRFEPNVKVIGAAVLALSYSKNMVVLRQFVGKLKKMNDAKIEDWNKIFIAFSNVCDYDAMIKEYNLMIHQFGLKANCVTFNILMSVKDKNVKIFALNETKRYIAKYGMREWHNMTHKELKRFFIEAQYCNDVELMKLLNPIMNKLTNLQKNVIAEIEYDGNKIYFDNLYKFEAENVLKKVNELIEKIGYNDEKILYHAEKKAIAFLLDKDENMMDVSIKINFRVCIDCHGFFLRVSEYYSAKIIVITDPRTVHKFNKGKCSCGKY